jgi:hypothetical protein
VSSATPRRVPREPRSLDLRPRAIVLSGLRRGVVLVFLPVVAAGQLIAWLEDAISGLFHPWSWLKIGLAYALAGLRVPFEATISSSFAGPRPATTTPLEFAVGALTVVIVVLAFRAGREQGAGWERRPGRAAAAGAVVGVGLAVPMFACALLVRLRLPVVGVDDLRPELGQAFVVPLAVGCVVGAVGGLASARGSLQASAWTARLTGAARGGFAAFWIGLAFAFIGFLAVAAIENGPTSAYARFVRDTGSGGAVLLVHHALVIPNQSAMLLATSMGSTTRLVIADDPEVDLTPRGIEPGNPSGASLMHLVRQVPRGREAVRFPSWFWLFLLVPTAATFLGGRRAAAGLRRRAEAVSRGALGGVVYAVLCALGAWAATLVLPIGAVIVPGPIRLGPDPWMTLLVAIPWGVVGGALGALWPEPVPPATASDPTPPR